MTKKTKKIKKTSLAICLCFFGTLLLFLVLTVVLPKKATSEMENKPLQEMPKFSAKDLFNGNYTSKLETYVSDHFSGRVSWISLKSGFEHLLGKREQNGVYILNDRLIEKVDEPDYELVDKNIEALNKFAADNADIPVYFMLVPTSAEFYKDELPYYYPNLDQRAFIDYIYNGLEGNGMSLIDVYQEMSANSDDYIYYRTDHHWTTKGAFLAYTAAGKKMGYVPLDYSRYDIEHASGSFKGTFYSKALYNGIEDDVMDYYHVADNPKPVTVEVTTEYGVPPEVYDSMYFRDYLNVKDKYSSFLGSNVPLETIKCDNDGGKLLVIKDSYAHCFVPFLTEHYSEITMLDMRYIQMSYKSVVDVSEYDQVLFLYNAASFSKDKDVRKLIYG